MSSLSLLPPPLHLDLFDDTLNWFTKPLMLQGKPNLMFYVVEFGAKGAYTFITTPISNYVVIGI